MRSPFDPTEDDAWTIQAPVVDPLREGDIESRFAIGNGLLSVRGTRDMARGPAWTSSIGTIRPASWPRAYVAGLFDVPDIQPPVPVLMPVPDWLRLHVRVAGEMLAPPPVADGGEVQGRRVLDLRRGVLVVEWRQRIAAGVTVRVRSLRAASRADPALGLQLVEVAVEGEADEVELELEARFDLAGVGLDLAAIGADCGLWRDSRGEQELAMAADAALVVGVAQIAPARREPLAWVWRWRARAGEPALLARLVAAARGDGAARNPAGPARDALTAALAQGWRAVLAAHESAWTTRWQESGVEVAGDEAARQALRFAVYHLVSAANPADERVSVGARALTGDAYLGHVFWDTEIYLLPFYILTWPEAARALLMYRHHTLPAARARAASLGWRGAMYAWESADTGAETTPDHILDREGKTVPVLSGRQEHHITADVAHAVWHYWHATHDDEFLRGPGAEILVETARFWASRTVPGADGRRHIRRVIGPDEYHEGVDDNAFTNVMARRNLCRAAEAAELLQARWPADWAQLGVGAAEVAQWREVAAALVTGFDPRTGLYEQFAGFFALDEVDLGATREQAVQAARRLGRDGIARSQIIKQADVVALLVLLPDEAGQAAQLANLRCYEARCTHESSLSQVMHALLAARLGEDAMALRHFREADLQDLDGRVGASAGGVHIAALGGLWQVAVMGFGGLDWHGDTLHLAPRLPREWQGLDYAVHWRGRRLRVHVAQDGAVRVTLESGDGLTIAVHGTPVTLAPGRPDNVARPAAAAGS